MRVAKTTRYCVNIIWRHGSSHISISSGNTFPNVGGVCLVFLRTTNTMFGLANHYLGGEETSAPNAAAIVGDTTLLSKLDGAVAPCFTGSKRGLLTPLPAGSKAAGSRATSFIGGLNNNKGDKETLLSCSKSELGIDLRSRKNSTTGGTGAYKTP